MLKKRWTRGLLIGIASLWLITTIIVPWAVEYYIESNSKELVGRKILLDDLDFTLLTGGVTVEKLDIYEVNDQDIFLHVEEAYVNLELWRILFGTAALAEVRVLQPSITVSQHGAGFNFDDLLKRFLATDSTSAEPAEPVWFEVERMLLGDGTVIYSNLDLAAEIKLIRIHAECPRLSSEDPRISTTFDFRFDKGGTADGNLQLDMKSMAYQSQYQLDSLNIGIFLPYVTAFLRAGALNGLFTSHQSVAGNLNTPTDIATSGFLQLDDFSLMDPREEKLVGFGEARVVIDSINLGRSIYDLQYARVNQPYLRVELFEEGNNYSRLMIEPPPDSTGISSDSLARAAAYGNVFALLAAYVREMSKLYAFSEYNADSLVIRRGTLVFNDFTLHNRFNYLLEELNVKADKVSSADDHITVEAASVLNTSGRLKGQLRVDPHGFNNLSIDYSITGLRVSDFNPYSNYYVAHPFTDGVCNYVSKSDVLNQHLKSSHVLDIESIKVGKKVKNNTAYKIPVKLAVALLRDKNGDIHLELPIEGNLNDPKYKIGKVIWQVFRNLISKAVASPGKLLAGKAGVEEKLLEGFDWKPLQTELTEAQTQSLDALAKSLETTPEMKAELIKLYNSPQETDELAVHEGKKKFLFFHRRIGSEEVIQPDEMAKVEEVHHNDSLFNAYLNKQVNTNGEMVSVYEKSRRLSGPEHLQRRLSEIYRRRNEAMMNYLTGKGFTSDRFVLADPEASSKMAYASPSRTIFKFYVDDN